MLILRAKNDCRLVSECSLSKFSNRKWTLNYMCFATFISDCTPPTTAFEVKLVAGIDVQYSSTGAVKCLLSYL
jgi:hypothetical protein